jgi:uncharacterized protein with von Willebrand factor type A (vWA) domain
VLLGFTRALRAAGVPVTVDRAQGFLAATARLGADRRRATYLAGRATLCGSPDDLARYDQVFAAYFDARDGLLRARPTATPTGLPTMPAPSSFPRDERPGPGEADPEEDVLRALASDTEVLRHRDVSVLTDAERDEVNRLIALLSPRVGLRRTRRRRPGGRDRIDVSRTVREMLRSGGEPATLARLRPRVKPRRLVLLLDVSGSMSPYADVLLRFAHAAVRVSPASAEVFTISTRLTRVTRQLRLRDPDEALAAAGTAIPDWSGGTRLGESLQAFLDLWGQRGIARRAVVVLASDGWERGDAGLLGEQMGRLARLAHRVVWVNPHRGKDGFAPITVGMTAALPHVDDLLAGHTLDALHTLADVIAHA